jgi:multidrug efflux pump
MSLSDLPVKRPVLSTVMSLLIVLAGIASFGSLPVREYPDVDYPLVSITTRYVGANAEAVESTVTEPLEQSLNGVEGIRAITSTSALGASAIQVEFVAGRDVDVAATDVTNAIQQALRRLPEEAERPVVAKSGANTRPIMWLHLKGATYSAVDLTDLADRIVKTPLQLLPGVANIIIGGQRQYAMRVWLDPYQMAAFGVDPADVRRTIRENNLQIPGGEIEGAARKFTVLADAKIEDPAIYENLVIRWDRDVPVRIKDVGWVELGSANYNTITRFSAEPIIGVGIVRQSRANELEVAAAVRGMLPALRAALPPGVTLDVATDTTVFVEAALQEVWFTLGIVFCVVVLVNLVFLRSLTTTAIASVAIPVSLIGTFAAMQALGFSINLLTLLALVLAVGLLVDDAIVVLENVYRHQELGEPRVPATRRGTREVFFAVMATTVAVVAVLVPLSLMTGNTGRLFREFSITLAVAVIISTFVALTLVPTMCATFLELARRHGHVYNAIERVLQGLNRGYARALQWSLRHRTTVVLFLVGNLAGSALLLWLLPATLVPIEDRGQFLTVIKAPQGSTLAYTFDTLRQVERRLEQIPEVRGFFAAIGLAVGGPQSTSDGFVYVRLHPWNERAVKQQEIVASLFPDFGQLPGALVFPINLPSLGQNTINDIEFILKNSSASLEEFSRVTDNVLERARQLPGLVNVDSNLHLDNPQVDVIFDRERAADLGVPVAAVAEALEVTFAQTTASEFVLRNKQYDVITALASPYRSAPGQIQEVHVRSRDGSMVPLSALVRVTPTEAPTALNHYDLQRAVTITASLAPGATLGETLAQIAGIAAEELPTGFTTALGGVSREFAESSAAVYLTFVVALLFIYLVLSAQFESFVHPLIILVAVPLALLGALLTLALSGNTMNLFSQIGVILLVGLVTKNSILLVDYTNQARIRGLALLAAAVKASKTRFRPILMTSFTSILGAVPLMLATGAGAESRRPIGAAVVGGLMFSTVFTLLIVPVIYVLLVGFAERFGITAPPQVSAKDNAAGHDSDDEAPLAARGVAAA